MRRAETWIVGWLIVAVMASAVDEVRWMPVDEARRLMTFETERQIVEEALPMVGHD